MQALSDVKKILRTQCDDAPGLISKITTLCYQHQLNIVENNEFVDTHSSQFFMRTALEGKFDEIQLLNQLDAFLPNNAYRELNPLKRPRIVIMVTSEAHCLGDLLIKHAFGGLDMTICAVIGNHETLRSLAERFAIPFIYISHQNRSRDAHEEQIVAQIEREQPDYIVLAKYMRILSPAFVQRYRHKIINIHHSFLPAFIGARPYHQAWHRGVKIIGATAHFVDDNLDEGPIISQDVIHINHKVTSEEMVRAGRDIEENVLSRALRDVFEQRVFIHNNRTIIL